MNDSPDMPEMSLVPNAIVQLAIPSDPFYTLETSSEIREKMSDLENDYSGEGHDNSGLLVLTEIELHTRPEVAPEAGERSLNPKLIAWIKGVHPRLWEDELKRAGEFNMHWKQEVASEGGDPLHGMPQPVKDLIEGLAGGKARIIHHPGVKSMTLAEFQAEGGPETECCCGHEANAHEVGDQKIGACTSCTCGHFHTHQSEKADADQAQD